MNDNYSQAPEWKWDFKNPYDIEKEKFLEIMKKTEIKQSKVKKEKPHINIGGIGHLGHGKTTLMHALLLTAGIKDKVRPSSTIDVKSVPFETNKYNITYFDCPGDTRYTKNMFVGASQLDTAILVVDASNGPMPQTREHIILARMAGIKNIIVFLNKTDLINDAELCDLVEMEVRDMLTQYEFNGDSVSIISGTALLAMRGTSPASIKRLINTIDKLVVPERQTNDFEMQIAKIVPKNGGVVAIGTIKNGILKEGEEIYAIGKWNQKLNCKFLESFCNRIPEAKAGDNIGIFFEGITASDIERGQILTKNKKAEVFTKFEAETYILSKDEGGRRAPFKDYYTPQFYFGSFDSPGTVEIGAVIESGKTKKKVEFIEPGENVLIKVELKQPFPLLKNMRVTIRDGQKTIGAGKISKIL